MVNLHHVGQYAWELVKLIVFAEYAILRLASLAKRSGAKDGAKPAADEHGH